MIGSPGTSVRRLGLLIVALTGVALAVAAAASAAQAGPSGEALRQQVERRFDVLLLQNGLALRPKSSRSRVTSIEITDGTVALDGSLVSGAELRNRLGDDADLVLRLTYLDPDARRRLFAPPSAPETLPTPVEGVTPPAPPAPPPAPDVEPERGQTSRAGRRRSSRGGTVKFGGSVTVGRGEVFNDDVVVIAGSAHVLGAVQGDVVVVGGSADLGPEADVSGDVTVIGGPLRRSPGAHVAGEVNEVGVGPLHLDRLRFRQLPLFFWWGSAMSGAFALVSTVGRFAVLCLLVSMVLLIGRDYVERVGARAMAEPIKAGAVGFLAQLVFLPLLIVSIIVLVITIIGIPLLVLVPFALLALAIVALVGFTAVAFDVGRFASSRMGWDIPNPYLTAIVGIAIVVGPVLMGRLLGFAGGLISPFTGLLVVVGLLFEYAAWTVGFGAVALTRFDRPRPTPPLATPGPPPTPAPPPTSA